MGGWGGYKVKNAKRNQYFPRSDSASLRKHVGRKIEKKVGEGGRFTIQKYFCENLRNPYSSSPHQVVQSINYSQFLPIISAL